MSKVLWAAFVHSPWDHMSDEGFWDTLRAKTRQLHASTDKALMISVGCNLFEWGTFLRRMDQFLMDLVLQPDDVERLLDELMLRHLDFLEKVCSAVGDLVDIMRLGDDLVKRWRTTVAEQTLVKTGRVTALITIILAIVWSLQLDHFRSIFQGISAMISYIAPPITAVFLWGVFWRRASGFAAVITLALGSLLGLTVFFLDWFKEDTGWNVPFLLAAFYLFGICSIILFIASMFRPHQHTEESERLVWAHPLDDLRSPGWSGLGDYRIVAGALFTTMVALYWTFS